MKEQATIVVMLGAPPERAREHKLFCLLNAWGIPHISTGGPFPRASRCEHAPPGD